LQPCCAARRFPPTRMSRRMAGTTTGHDETNMQSESAWTDCVGFAPDAEAEGVQTHFLWTAVRFQRRRKWRSASPGPGSADRWSTQNGRTPATQFAEGT
jgi:hypothetical protein